MLDFYLHIYLKNSNGKGISGKSITVQINGKTYTRTTDKNGAVCFNFSSLLGKYSLKVKVTSEIGNSIIIGNLVVNNKQIAETKL